MIAPSANDRDDPQRLNGARWRSHAGVAPALPISGEERLSAVLLAVRRVRLMVLVSMTLGPGIDIG